MRWVIPASFGVLPYKALDWSLNIATTAIGCSTGQIFGLSVLTALINPDYAAIFKKARIADPISQWNKDFWAEETKAKEIMRNHPGIREGLYNNICEASPWKSSSTPRQFWVGSDNLDDYTGIGWETSDFFQYLIDAKGWGCISSHIGVNPMHPPPSAISNGNRTNCQVWILTEPERLAWLYPGTSFRANLGYDKLGGMALFDTPSDKERQASMFMSDRKYSFKNYIAPKIKKLLEGGKNKGNFYGNK